MVEEKSHSKLPLPSERSFGMVFTGVFFIAGCYLSLSGSLVLWPFLAAFTISVLSVTRPQLLAFPNKIWFRFGIMLGAFVAPLIMSLLFFLVLWPTGLLLRAFKKDPLNQIVDKNIETYWINRQDDAGSMRDPF